MGGIGYYRNCLPDLSKRLRLINSPPRKGVKVFKPARKNWFEKSSRSSILVFPS